MNGRRFSTLALRRRRIVAAIEDWLVVLLALGAILGGSALVELVVRWMGL